MTRIKPKKICDFKYCNKTNQVKSVTIMQQVPYELWRTIHACPEHKKVLKETIQNELKPSIAKQFRE